VDEVVVGALGALAEMPPHDPELFFDLLSLVYEDMERTEDGADYEPFCEAFLSRMEIEGFRDPAWALLRYLDFYGTTNKIEDIRLISREDRQDLLDELDRLMRSGGDDYDGDAWQDFLVEHARNWNGSEDTWDEFAADFLHDARAERLLKPAQDLIDEAEDADNKIAVFSGYGVVIETEDDDETYDEDEWEPFLADFGPQWDGQESSWDEFVTNFLDAARERRLYSPAKRLIDQATESDDKVGLLSEYGVVIEGGAADLDAAADALRGVDVEAEWQSFLTDLAVYWDGLDDTWQPFVDYFLYQAGERIPGLDADPDRNPILRRATDLVEYVSAAGPADYKIRVLDQYYDVQIEPPGDPEPFYDFLGRCSGYWDGLEVHWEPFRTWFLYEAREQGVGKYATLWIDEAELQGFNKPQFFALYSVQLSPVEPQFAADAVKEAVERVAAQPTSTVPPADVPLLTEAFAELVELMPEVVGFSDEDIALLLEQVTVHT
jgi:hypothetical protein